jgi:hypothetical protein
MSIEPRASAFYVTAQIRMRNGSGTELARFHTDVDPTALDRPGQQQIVDQLLRDKGLDPRDVTDDGERNVVFSVFKTESECKRAYDEVVRATQASPDSKRANRVMLPVDRPCRRDISIREHLLIIAADMLLLERNDPDSFRESLRGRRALFTAAVQRAQQEGWVPPISDALQNTTVESLVLEHHMVLEWARYGFPRVQLDHRIAAEMMWTRTPASVLNELRAPWACFWLEIPTDLIALADGEGDVIEVTNALLMFEAASVTFSYGNKFDLFGTWVVTSLADCGDFTSQGPAAEMLANLIVGVCADLAAHRPAPTRRKPPSRRPGRGRGGAPPDTTDYVVIRRAVSVADPTRGGECDERAEASAADCVKAVRAYVRGEQTTQRLHRGHYQMQVYGEKLAQRRLQYHRPYWQGPIDAPIAIRPHHRR